MLQDRAQTEGPVCLAPHADSVLVKLVRPGVLTALRCKWEATLGGKVREVHPRLAQTLGSRVFLRLPGVLQVSFPTLGRWANWQLHERHAKDLAVATSRRVRIRGPDITSEVHHVVACRFASPPPPPSLRRFST